MENMTKEQNYKCLKCGVGTPYEVYHTFFGLCNDCVRIELTASGSVAAPKEEEISQPYFHLSKNEYGKMWLMYKPEGNGRYKCWEPITEEFWNEFEKLLRLKLDNKIYQETFDELVPENTALREALKELLPIAERKFNGISIDDAASHREYIALKAIIERARKLLSK